MEKYEIPDILYDEPDERNKTKRNLFPFILVAQGKKMPPVLFIEERRETGEFEPDLNGNPCPVVDCLLHMYVDMEFLKEKLTPEVNDQVRVALGLKPLKEAQEAGQKILDKVQENVNKIIEEAKSKRGGKK